MSSERASLEGDIKFLRQGIDHLDTQILGLLEHRGIYAKAIRAMRPERDLEREKTLRLRIAMIYRGPYPLDAIERIFEVLFDASEKL